MWLHEEKCVHSAESVVDGKELIDSPGPACKTLAIVGQSNMGYPKALRPEWVFTRRATAPLVRQLLCQSSGETETLYLLKQYLSIILGLL